MDKNEAEKKRGRYRRLLGQFMELQEKSRDLLANMATINALLYHKMPGFFWVGFYFRRGDELVAGPYQGPLACQTLEKDKGVCWAAVNRRESVVVGNVHEFPDHITCDGRSNSEIVVPLFDANDEVYAVLDIDSREFGHFDNVDAEELERLTECLIDE